MKKGRKLNNSNSSFKSKWLHIGKTYGLIILLTIINCSCEKEDSQEYYVKYITKNSTVELNGLLNISFNSENNETITLVINQNTVWERTVGPVQKGFSAKIEVSNKTDTRNSYLCAEIQVSKDNSPFATKAIKDHRESYNGGNAISMFSTYTIDY
jgi:hypothetical protein